MPRSIAKTGIRPFRRFSAIIHFSINDIKTKVGAMVISLALEGPFPDHSDGMLLPADLTDDKKRNWETRIEEFLRYGRITQKVLESLTARLSFSQTSIFGRFGRATTHPLSRKLYIFYYDNPISDVDRITIEWRMGLLNALHPRAIYPMRNSPDIAIFTDAAKTTMIMACAVSRKADFDTDTSALSCKEIASGPGGVEYFTGASLIYGLELTALVSTTADPNLPLGGLGITYYIDNAACALIRGDSRIVDISIIARLFGHPVPFGGFLPGWEGYQRMLISRISIRGRLYFHITLNKFRILHSVANSCTRSESDWRREL